MVHHLEMLQREDHYWNFDPTALRKCPYGATKKGDSAARSAAENSTYQGLGSNRAKRGREAPYREVRETRPNILCIRLPEGMDTVSRGAEVQNGVGMK